MRKSPIAVLFFGCLATMLMTQNCTQPAATDSSALRSQQANSLPFGYDAKINQIAYMSCSIMPANAYDRSAYFSIRAGAYDNAALLGLPEDNGGIRLTSEFLTSNPIRNRKVDDIWQIMSESPANAGTIMQLAVRGSSKLQNIFVSSGTANPDVDYANMFEALGVTGVNKALVELGNGKRLRYLTNGTVQGSRMEGTLHFGNSESVAQQLRTQLNSDDNVLTVTYSELKASGGAEFSARSPASVWPTATPTPNENLRVYGRGYHLRFTKPAGTTSAYPTNILQSVTEADLMGTSDRAGTWNCSDLRFKIIRPEDAAAQGCIKGPDPLVPDKNLKIARNSLRYEDWYIDMTNRCIIPKKNGPGCYNTYTVIQYDLTRECLPNPATNNALVDLNKACLAFASVCYRVN